LKVEKTRIMDKSILLHYKREIRITGQFCSIAVEIAEFPKGVSSKPDQNPIPIVKLP
jgi:hypothetical protein